MYKLKDLIDKGLDINSLPEDIKKDIEYIKITSNDFATDYNVALEMDEIIAARIENEILNPVESADNPFIGDTFFKKNPDKVLGEQTTGGRFGDAIVVKGKPDIIKNIDVIVPEKVFKGLDIDIPIEKESISKKVKKIYEATNDAVNKSKNEKIIRAITKEESENPQVMSFREVVEKYNSNISRKELEAFLYSRPDLPYSKYIDTYENRLTDLMNEGYLFWDENKFEYSHIFLSGDVHKKRTNTVRDKTYIVEHFGEDYYEMQLKALDSNMPEYIHISEEKGGINLLPHSEFSKTFSLKKENYMFLRNTYVGEETISLFKAFDEYLKYINRHTPGLFSGSNYTHLFDYLIGKKIKSRSKGNEIDKKIQEKEEKYAWQKAKEIADRLFLKMLYEEITIEGKQVLETIWNEKYNTYKLPDYSKIPVGFTISKFFGTKELELNVMQRESVAFMSYIKSGINAGGVGLGKSLSGIASISQAVENGKATCPLLIVPNNVYEKWIRDIKGYRDDENDKNMIGALHHYPAMRRLYNMSPDVVYTAKIYTDSERKAIEDLKNNFELVREQKKKILEDNKIHDTIFNANENPYAAIAIDALQAAKIRVASKIEKLQKDWKAFIEKGASYPDEYIVKRQKEMEALIKKEEDKLPVEFARFYYDLVKDEYIHLIYSTGQFEKVPAGTITIITHDAIKGNYLGVRDSEMLVKRLYEILSQGDRFEDPKEATKLYDKIVERVESIVGSSKIFIEDLGIDYLIIDEAHAFKKIFTSLKGEAKKDSEGNIVQKVVEKETATSKYAEREFNYYELDYGQPSGIALSGYFLTQYIQLTNNGGNTLLLTATPFENSPLEIYGMLSMANHSQLEQYGFKGIKEFFDTFMKIEYDYKVKINGVERDTVLNGFVNLPQLRTIVRNVILHRTGEQIEGLIRPDKVVLPLFNSDLFDDIHEIKTMLVPTDEQRRLQKMIEAYINSEISLSEIQYGESEKQLIEDLIKEEEELIEEQFSESGSDDTESISQAKKNLKIEAKFQTEAEQDGTRIIQGINYIKQITGSPYMLKIKKDIGAGLPTAKEFVETSPKLLYIVECIKSVKKHHEVAGTPVSGQIIYMTWGKMFFPLIKEYLTDPKFGIRFAKDEVEIISGDQSKNRKEELKKAFNDNKIKVLIASKSIQVGADLQKHTSVLYHVFYDWNPTDNEQVNGRAWRQGNKHYAVRIVYPMVENSIDPVIFQYLEEKTLRIKDVWDLASIKSQLDLSEFDPRRLKLDAITDPAKKAKLAIAVEKEKLNEELSYYRNILDPIRDVPYIINQFYDSLKEIPDIHGKFFFAESMFKSHQLKAEWYDKVRPVENELNNVREPIGKLEIEINNIEVEFDEKINILTESLSNLDSDLQNELSALKSKITEAAMGDDDKLLRELKRQYSELPKVYEDQKKVEIQNKIDKIGKDKEKATKPQRLEINKLNEKIGEKIEKLNSKKTEIDNRYNKKISDNDEYYIDKRNKTNDLSKFESKEKYYTFLYSNCTDIIKFLDARTTESGYYDTDFESIKNRASDIKQSCGSFKQYRDDYYRAIKLYLEPMSIKEDDALQVVQVYQAKINEILEKIGNVEELYTDLYKKYDLEYQERMAVAKTPVECASDFAKLNFLLDHVRTELMISAPEPEEILPEGIEIEVPELDEEQKEEFVPDEKYLVGKIKIFEKVLKVEKDEKQVTYLKTKIKIFNRVLSSLKKDEGETKVEIAAYQEYGQGGILGSKNNIKSLASYFDLVDENLMTKKQLLQFIKFNSEKLLPKGLIEQIKECTNFDLIKEILKQNNLI